jgi:hypothetical protein
LSPGASPPPVEIAIRMSEEMDRVVVSNRDNLSRRHGFKVSGTPKRPSGHRHRRCEDDGGDVRMTPFDNLGLIV